MTTKTQEQLIEELRMIRDEKSQAYRRIEAIKVREAEINNTLGEIYRASLLGRM